ncbi:MAG: hypothetical protein FWG59_01380, partial [Betaproteobacteria bacterium]|nr:hypothetical protein [Betaproteobacteria bacterium]
MKQPLLYVLALGLVFAPLSSVFGQSITIDGTSGPGGDGIVTHNVYGNGDPTTDGSDAIWPPYPASAADNSVTVNSGGSVAGW